MTGTKYSARALTARPDVLALMDTRPLWSFGHLRTTLNLDAPVLQQVLADLTARGELRPRFVMLDPEVGPNLHYSLNRARPVGLRVRNLSALEEQVVAFLLGRKETLTGICTALDHPKLKIIQALAWLDEQELITCAFIGHLPIFSLPLHTASSERTA